MTGLKGDAKDNRAAESRGRELTPQELEAELFDNGDLADYYEHDEREIAVYEGLHYSEERQEWFARFVPARPADTADPTPDDATYQQVLHRGRCLHASRVKPSQSFKALRAFGARLDRAVQSLKLEP